MLSNENKKKEIWNEMLKRGRQIFNTLDELQAGNCKS